jgi:flagellar hook-associated protein 2
MIVAGLSVNGTSLYSMGISSAGYTENGKLEIDETKLKEALQTKSSDIRALFTSADGIGNALNEVITKATKTSGVKGSRGTLVEVAGVDSTMSDTENSIYEQIKRINKNVSTLQSRLTREETRLWNKFTAMETALQRLNSQSSILSQFSSNSQY